MASFLRMSMFVAFLAAACCSCCCEPVGRASGSGALADGEPLPYFNSLAREYLGFSSVDIQMGTDKKELSIWPREPDIPEWSIDLPFFPLAIDGDGTGSLFVAGVDSQGLGVIATIRLGEAEIADWSSSVAFRSSFPAMITGVAFLDRGDGRSTLVALDALNEDLFVLDLQSGLTRILVSGSRVFELRGMRSMELVPTTDGQVQILLSDQLDPGHYDHLTVLTTLIDQDGDLEFETVRQSFAGAGEDDDD